jgi:hypothetical protein
MCHIRGRNTEKSLSFCHLTKQRLINELADGVNERHCRHGDSSPDYRPKFHVFTEKADRLEALQEHLTVNFRLVPTGAVSKG